MMKETEVTEKGKSEVTLALMNADPKELQTAECIRASCGYTILSFH